MNRKSGSWWSRIVVGILCVFLLASAFADHAADSVATDTSTEPGSSDAEYDTYRDFNENPTPTKFDKLNPSQQADYLSDPNLDEGKFQQYSQQYYSTPSNVGTGKEVDKRYFGNVNNIGKNPDADKSFFSESYANAGSSDSDSDGRKNIVNNVASAEKHFQLAYRLKVQFKEGDRKAGDTLKYDADAKTITNGGKTIPLDDFSGNPNIESIQVIEDLIIINERSGDNIKTTKISGSGEATIKYDKEKQSFTFWTVAGRQTIHPEQSTELSFDEQGNIKIIGQSKLDLYVKDRLVKVDNRAGVLLVNPGNGHLLADNALYNEIGGRLYIDGRFEVTSDERSKENHVGKIDLKLSSFAGKDTVVVDKYSSIGVRSQGQSREDAALVHLDTIAPAAPASDADVEEKAQQTLQSSPVDKAQSAEVWIQSSASGLNVEVIAQGKVEVGYFHTSMDKTAVGEINHGLPRFVGKSGTADFSYHKQGSREDFVMRGEALYSDGQLAAAENKQDGSIFRKIISPANRADADFFESSCASCAEGQEITSISKHIVIGMAVGAGLTDVVQEVDTKNLGISLVKSGAGSKVVVDANSFGSAAVGNDDFILLGKDIYIQDEGANNAFGLSKEGIGKFEVSESGIVKKQAVIDLKVRSNVGERVLIVPKNEKEHFDILVRAIETGDFSDLGDIEFKDESLRKYITAKTGIHVQHLNQPAYVRELERSHSFLQGENSFASYQQKLKEKGILINNDGRCNSGCDKITRSQASAGEIAWLYSAAEVQLLNGQFHHLEAEKVAAQAEGKNVHQMVKTQKSLQKKLESLQENRQEYIQRERIRAGQLPDDAKFREDHARMLELKASADRLSNKIHTLDMRIARVKLDLQEEVQGPEGKFSTDWEKIASLQQERDTLLAQKSASEQAKFNAEADAGRIAREYTKSRPDVVAQIASETENPELVRESAEILAVTSPELSVFYKGKACLVEGNTGCARQHINDMQQQGYDQNKIAELEVGMAQALATLTRQEEAEAQRTHDTVRKKNADFKDERESVFNRIPSYSWWYDSVDVQLEAESEKVAAAQLQRTSIIAALGSAGYTPEQIRTMSAADVRRITGSTIEDSDVTLMKGSTTFRILEQRFEGRPIDEQLLAQQLLEKAEFAIQSDHLQDDAGYVYYKELAEKYPHTPQGQHAAEMVEKIDAGEGFGTRAGRLAASGLDVFAVAGAGVQAASVAVDIAKLTKTGYRAATATGRVTKAIKESTAVQSSVEFLAKERSMTRAGSIALEEKQSLHRAAQALEQARTGGASAEEVRKLEAALETEKSLDTLARASAIAQKESNPLTRSISFVRKDERVANKALQTAVENYNLAREEAVLGRRSAEKVGAAAGEVIDAQRSLEKSSLTSQLNRAYEKVLERRSAEANQQIGQRVMQSLPEGTTIVGSCEPRCHLEVHPGSSPTIPEPIPIASIAARTVPLEPETTRVVEALHMQGADIEKVASAFVAQEKQVKSIDEAVSAGQEATKIANKVKAQAPLPSVMVDMGPPPAKTLEQIVDAENMRRFESAGIPAGSTLKPLPKLPGEITAVKKNKEISEVNKLPAGSPLKNIGGLVSIVETPSGERYFVKPIVDKHLPIEFLGVKDTGRRQMAARALLQGESLAHVPEMKVVTFKDKTSLLVSKEVADNPISISKGRIYSNLEQLALDEPQMMPHFEALRGQLDRNKVFDLVFRNTDVEYMVSHGASPKIVRIDDEFAFNFNLGKDPFDLKEQSNYALDRTYYHELMSDKKSNPQKYASLLREYKENSNRFAPNDRIMGGSEGGLKEFLLPDGSVNQELLERRFGKHMQEMEELVHTPAGKQRIKAYMQAGGYTEEETARLLAKLDGIDIRADVEKWVKNEGNLVVSPDSRLLTPQEALEEIVDGKPLQEIPYFEPEEIPVPKLDKDLGIGEKTVGGKKKAVKLELSSPVDVPQPSSAQQVQSMLRKAAESGDQSWEGFYKIYNAKEGSIAGIPKENIISTDEFASFVRQNKDAGEYIIAPGFMGFQSKGTFKALPKDQRVRVYLNARDSSAGQEIAGDIARTLHEKNIPYQVKTANEHKTFATRTDNTVLYVSKDNFEEVHGMLRNIAATKSELLDEGSPIFTNKIAKGIAWGEDPATGTFGEMRAKALAEIAEKGKGKNAQEIERLSQDIFVKAGIDPDEPWLNVGSQLKEAHANGLTQIPSPAETIRSIRPAQAAKGLQEEDYNLEQIVSTWDNLGPLSTDVISTHPIIKYQNPLTGEQVLIKGGPTHTTRADFIGQRVFALSGLPVPKTSLALREGELHQVLEFIPDFKSLQKMPPALHDDPIVQSGFVFDSLIGNYDRANWNMMYKEGKVIFIDEGASIGSSATGRLKPFYDTVDIEQLKVILTNPQYGGAINPAYLNFVEIRGGKLIVKNEELMRKNIASLKAITNEQIDAIVAESYKFTPLGEQQKIIRSRKQSLTGSTDTEKISIRKIAQRIESEFGGSEEAYIKHALKQRRDSLAELLESSLSQKLPEPRFSRAVSKGENAFELDGLVFKREADEWWKVMPQGSKFKEVMVQDLEHIVELEAARMKVPVNVVENSAKGGFNGKLAKVEVEGRILLPPHNYERAVFDTVRSVGDGSALSKENIRDLVILRAKEEGFTDEAIDKLKINFDSLYRMSEVAGSDVASFSAILEKLTPGYTNVHLFRDGAVLGASDEMYHSLKQVQGDVRIIYVSRDTTLAEHVFEGVRAGTVNPLEARVKLAESNRISDLLSDAQRETNAWVKQRTGKSPRKLENLDRFRLAETLEKEYQLSYAEYQQTFDDIFQKEFNARIAATDDDAAAFRSAVQKNKEYLEEEGLLKKGAKLRFIDTCCTGTINYFLKGIVHHYHPESSVDILLMQSSVPHASAGLKGHKVETLFKPVSASYAYEPGTSQPLFTMHPSPAKIGDEGNYVDNVYGQDAEKVLAYLDQLVVLQKTAEKATAQTTSFAAAAP